MSKSKQAIIDNLEKITQSIINDKDTMLGFKSIKAVSDLISFQTDLSVLFLEYEAQINKAYNDGAMAAATDILNK